MNDAKFEGKEAAGKMVTGEQLLQKSIDEFMIGAAKNGCPEPLLRFIEFGFWMGSNACMTRAMFMVEQSENGEKGFTPNDLFDEISEGLDGVSTEEMFKAFRK